VVVVAALGLGLARLAVLAAVLDTEFCRAVQGSQGKEMMEALPEVPSREPVAVVERVRQVTREV
jgi:hypothetical protein